MIIVETLLWHEEEQQQYCFFTFNCNLCLSVKLDSLSKCQWYLDTIHTFEMINKLQTARIILITANYLSWCLSHFNILDHPYLILISLFFLLQFWNCYAHPEVHFNSISIYKLNLLSIIQLLQEEFEDTKGVIRICKSKDKQHNG